jgi:hypothetical protein
MSATVLYMSMSLDGFIAGPNEGPDNGLGDGGHRLHEWFWTDADDDRGVPGRPAGINTKGGDSSMTAGPSISSWSASGSSRARQVSLTCTTGSSAEVSAGRQSESGRIRHG